ncbi:HAD family phosphatase [Rhizobacter sp. Root404]|uniref:HAD family hydrolase n=1 Tax=Rhizobacter sp. Root404 TaxID=1736528 RepID=UPI000A4E0060|nr:HAD family phosphatase [Rhizobacter sp. Root404]
MGGTTAAYAAAVFDMDGLLLDSERPVRDAWMQVAADAGVALTPAAYLDLIGRNHRDSTLRLRAIFGDDALLADARRRVERLLAERFGERPFDVKPGARRLLQALRDARIPRAVASSTHRAEIERRLARADLLDFFQAVCGGDEVTHGKPAPDIYLLAVTRLGVAAPTTLAFEDSGHGALAAIAAGLGVVVVPDLKPPEPAWQSRSVAVLDSLEAAAAYSAAWFGIEVAG